MINDKRAWLLIFVYGMLVLAVLFIAWRVLTYDFAESFRTITIDEKWVDVEGSQGKYLVSDTNDNVYIIQDSFLYWRFDSSNLYNMLEENMTCVVTLQGERMPFFSWYPNIVRAACESYTHNAELNDMVRMCMEVPMENKSTTICWWWGGGDK